MIASSCARGPSMDARPNTGPSIIDRIDPTSAPAGEGYPIDLMIYGSGFAEADNTNLPHHSVRMAVIGSTRVARRAGRYEAINATPVNNMATPT